MNKRQTFAIALTCLALAATGATLAQRQTTLIQRPVWISRDIKWQAAPKEYNPNLSAGHATVLYFATDGRFGMLQCLINRVGSVLTISVGDGYAIHEGQWASVENRITLHERLVYETLPAIGGTYPGPEIVEIAMLAAKGQRLQLGQASFVPAPATEELRPPRLEQDFFKFRGGR